MMNEATRVRAHHLAPERGWMPEPRDSRGLLAEFAYREAGILPGFVPTSRTLDVDFLVRNLHRPNPPGVPRRIRGLATLQNPIALKLRSEPGGRLNDEARSLGQVLLVQNERLLMQCLKERALTIRYDRREQSVRRRRLAR